MNKDLYPEDLARRIAHKGGGPYRPSNGTEADMFMERWCEHCLYDRELGCDILAASLAFADYPSEWCHDANGQPCCTAFKGMTMAEAEIARERGKETK